MSLAISRSNLPASVVSTNVASPANPADATWFTMAADSSYPATGVFESLASHALALSQRRQETMKQLKTATDTSVSPIQIHQSTRALSAYYLDSVLTAKIIGKAANALEKITNLQ
ncbi:EscI/YscI/HrpB family type III secretion system inner rod protein [Pseudomonas yamanorum]|uniref:EscI/YscI/HrpB family type III secretion system inner rod protein n=1 Tax=Pseudomonas yamanorum TaxID=515393 RepID=UPI00087BF717|nr:EscI/YscI/HrpB family type III secretion system inner rod protein [Pseudomonas yamanorum]SDT99672.1 type III secretion system major needle protein, YscF/MxiH/PrgI family [Pseudomonas yamanorum]